LRTVNDDTSDESIFLGNFRSIPVTTYLFQAFENMTKSRFSTSLSLLCVLAFLGCGSDDTPPLGEVTGKITLDGQPLEGVIVLFKPEVGRVATGTTNADGEYELEFAYEVSGCKAGPNRVSLEWPLGSTNAKTLSAKYTTASELKAEVKEGSNKIDFALESDAGTSAETITIPD
jgi:hypothetical protein